MPASRSKRSRPRRWARPLVVTATIHPDQDRLARVAPRIEGRITVGAGEAGRHRCAPARFWPRWTAWPSAKPTPRWTQAQAELRIAEADFKRAESLNADEIIPRKDFLRAQGRPRQGRSRPARRSRPTAPAGRLAKRQRQQRLRLCGHGAVCGHRDREEGDAGRAGHAERAHVHRRRPEPRVDSGRPARSRAGEGARGRQREGHRAGLSGRDLQRHRRPHRRTCSTRTRAPSPRASKCRTRTAGSKPEMFATATIETNGEKRDAHLAARRGHRAAGRQADGLRLRARRVRSARGRTG